MLRRQGEVILTNPPYTFGVHNREVAHLRGPNSSGLRTGAFVDYVGSTSSRPILGEVKRNEKNPFYALIQLLTYLSEIATENQIERWKEFGVFGERTSQLTWTFDLHIVLDSFPDESAMLALSEPTSKLARSF